MVLEANLQPKCGCSGGDAGPTPQPLGRPAGIGAWPPAIAASCSGVQAYCSITLSQCFGLKALLNSWSGLCHICGAGDESAHLRSFPCAVLLVLRLHFSPDEGGGEVSTPGQPDRHAGTPASPVGCQSPSGDIPAQACCRWGPSRGTGASLPQAAPFSLALLPSPSAALAATVVSSEPGSTHTETRAL